MGILRKAAVIFLAGVVLFGCQAGKAPIPVQTAPPPVESARNFVFAESPFLNIDSDMMAEQFFTDQVPAMVTMDSATVLNSVYGMLFDSLLGKDADSFNLQVVPNLYRQYVMLRYDRVMRLMFQKVIVDSVPVSDSEVTAAYQAAQVQYQVPDQYRVRHIVISGPGINKSADSALYRSASPADLDSIALGIITGLRDRILKGEAFDTMAMVYSQDNGSAPKGGDLGYQQLANLVAPFDSTVQHTPIGEISGVIKTMFGWHIIRVDEFLPAHIMPLDSVRGEIAAKIRDDKLMQRSRQFVDSLRAEGKVDVDSISLSLPDSLHKPEDMVAVVNPGDQKFGRDTVTFLDYSEQVYPFQRSKRIDRPLTYDEKKELIDNLSVRYHLLRTARQLGYYDDPVIETWAAGVKKRYAVSMMKKNIIDENYVPPDSLVRAYYDAHLSDYQVDRPLTVQHIIFADSSMAENMRDILRSGGDFLEAAQQYYPGEPDIRKAAADLGEIGPRDMPPAFYATALSTPVGDISHPVKTEFGFHLIKVLSKNYSVDFDRAAMQIRPKLKKEYQEGTRKEFVERHLGTAPTIHWDKMGDLYRKEVPGPSGDSGSR